MKNLNSKGTQVAPVHSRGIVCEYPVQMNYTDFFCFTSSLHQQAQSVILSHNSSTSPLFLYLPFQNVHGPTLACVADETKPRYSPSANQRPKACSVLPGFSIIGSYWLLHLAVLSCTVIGRVAWNHGYAGGYTK